MLALTAPLAFPNLLDYMAALQCAARSLLTMTPGLGALRQQAKPS
jgi:hypothetical protein